MSDHGCKMKTWDLPRTEEEGIRLFQNKRVLLKTKQCVNGNSMTLCFFNKKHLVQLCHVRKVGLGINTWFADIKILLLSLIFFCSFHNCVNKVLCFHPVLVYFT